MRYTFILFIMLLSASATAQNIGIGTSTPKARLHVSDSAVLFSGSPNVNIFTMAVPPEEGQGTRMFWYPQKAAFRAGYVQGSNWNRDNIGVYSIAGGYDSKAYGYAATSWGNKTDAAGSYATALGSETQAAGAGSLAAGVGTVAKAFAGTTIGLYNNTGDLPSGSSPAATDRIFQIGNGTSDASRSNALTVLQNGNTGYGTISPLQKIDIYKGRIRFTGEVGSSSSHGIEFTNNAGNALNGFIGAYNDSMMGFYGYTGAGWKMLFNNNNGNLGLQGNANPRAPLAFSNANGNKLDIYYGSENSRYGIGLQSALMQFYSGSASDDIAFGYGSSAAFTERMRIKGNGNVGIGTTSPGAKLEVNGNVRATQVSVAGTNASYPLTVQADGMGVGQVNAAGNIAAGFSVSSSNAYVQTHTAHDLNFTTNNGSTKMTLQNGTGNVGIGTTNPGAKLEVNGTAKTTGMEVNGTTKTTSLQMPTGAGAGKVLTSDASGNASWQENPVKSTAFLAFLPANTQIVPYSNFVVPFTDNATGLSETPFDNGLAFNNTTHKYTAAQAGLYHFSFKLTIGTSGVGGGSIPDYHVLPILNVINGTGSHEKYWNAITISQSNPYTAVCDGRLDIYLDAGSTVSVEVLLDNSYTTSIWKTDDSRFTGHRIY